MPGKESLIRVRGIDAETELGVADSILVDDDKRLVSKEFVASARSFFDRTVSSFKSVGVSDFLQD